MAEESIQAQARKRRRERGRPMRSPTTWRTLLEREFRRRGDDFAAMTTTLTEAQLDEEFEANFGTAEGEPFTAWGERYVYFPVVYDGAEWVGSVPRNPCDKKTTHIGCQ